LYSEKDKAVEKVNNELLKREIKQVIQQEELQRDFNEVTEVVIKSSDSAVRDRLSGFNRD
jgi:nickel-dependent lactate racemase